MTETRTHMLARLRAMRQKHHLGEFKNYRKSSSSHKYKGVKMAKKHYSRRKSSGFGSGMWGSIIGVGVFTLIYEPFISPMIPLSEPTKSIAELGLGIMFMKKPGIIGNVAKASVIINSYQLMALYIKPMIMGQTPGQF